MRETSIRLLVSALELVRPAFLDQGDGKQDMPDALVRCEVVLQEGISDASLNVATLGERCGCHPDHLTRLSRKHWGQSLVEWLSDRRLERARELLSEPNLRISEVAHRCGFKDALYFSRLFRRRCGCSPSQFRHQLRQGG